MKKLTLLLLIPILSFGQDVGINEYYDNGQKITEKTWKEGEQYKTLVEIVDGEVTSYRYYISQNDVEIGVNAYSIRDYGKYFKVDVSIINNSSYRYDFLVKNIDVEVYEKKEIYGRGLADNNGNRFYLEREYVKLLNNKKYRALTYDEYINKVTRRQNSNAFWLAFAQGMNSSGTTYSQSNTTYNDGYNYGYATTNTTTYSPALQQMQARQNAQDMSRFQNEQQERRNFINEGYLKNHTLFPNTQLEGYFLIPYHKKVTDIDMIIKLGNMEFDYSNDKWGQ